MGELEHTVQEPVDTIFPVVSLVLPVVLGEAADYIIPNWASDLRLVVEGFVATYRMIYIARFNQRLKIRVYNKWRSDSVSI